MRKKPIVIGWIALLFSSVLVGCKASNSEYVEEGMNFIEEMEYEEALNNFEKALEDSKDERLIYRGMGIAYMGLTEYKRAIDSFKKCLQLSNGVVQDFDFDVNYYLATAYFKDGQYEEAEKTYSAILDMHPKEMDAYLYRGKTRLALEEDELAKEDFDYVLKKNPTDYNQLIEICNVYEEYGYHEIGKENLQQILSENGEHMNDYDKGRVYYYLEDYEQACQYLEKSKKDGFADSFLYLGKAYEATGDYNYAASVYNSYITKDETDARVYNQLGLCRLKQQEYQLALEAFQAAMNIEGNDMMQTLRYNEIVALEYLGEYQKASVFMENYISMYPDDVDAQREAKFLKTR